VAALVTLVAGRALPDDGTLFGEVIRNAEQGSEDYLARVETLAVLRGRALGDARAALIAVSEVTGPLYLAETLPELRAYFWQ
jgi:hypothetical protein